MLFKKKTVVDKIRHKCSMARKIHNRVKELPNPVEVLLSERGSWSSPEVDLEVGHLFIF